MVVAVRIIVMAPNFATHVADPFPQGVPHVVQSSEKVLSSAIHAEPPYEVRRPHQPVPTTLL